MIYYFDYVRTNSERQKSKISRYSFDSGKKQIYTQLYVDGALSDNQQVVQSDTTLKNFKKYRINKVKTGSFADVTKIQGNEPIKRILYERNNKYYCKESDDKAFNFEDELLNEKEKNYIIVMGE